MQNSVNKFDAKQVNIGAILSYGLIVFSSLYNLIITPFMLGTIGESEYGVYKIIGAMAATLAILDLGLGSTAQRFLAKYRAEQETEKCYNFSAMSMIQAGILAVGISVIGFFLYFSITPMYSESFTTGELIRAKQIYVLLIVYTALHVFENVLFGIISGYNRFIFINSFKIVSIVIKTLLYLVILPIFQNSVAVVLVSLFIEVLTILIEFLYMSLVLHHKIKLYFWDSAVFKESFVYTLLLFVQAIIIQFNGNIDNIVIGAVIGTGAVTVYSFAIQIFSMYEQCATSISGVILPSITDMIHAGATTKDLENVVIKYGRVQWMVLGAALGGFICLGREFFALWLGAGFEDCYYLSLILMIPVSFPLIVNVCLAILKAKNLLKFRTVALAYSAVFNALFTVIGTQIWGYWAAAIGTAFSTILSGVISLNIYYSVKLKMNMIRIYFQIMGKITLALLLPCICCLMINNFFSGTWVSFFFKVAVFVLIYGIILFVFSFAKNKRFIFKWRSAKK